MKILLYANSDWFMYNFNRSLSRTLSNRGHKVYLLCPVGKYFNLLINEGFSCVQSPLKRSGLNIFGDVIFLSWLYKFLRDYDIQVVHSFTLKCAMIASLVGRIARVPRIVCSITGLGYIFTSSDFKARLLRPLIEFLMRLIFMSERVKVIVLNETDRRYLRYRKVVTQARLHVVRGSGIDCFSFRPVSKNADRFVVLLACRIVRDKGVHEYVAAAQLLKSKGLPIRFWLAGEPDRGNPSSIQIEVISTWVREGVIDYLGHVSDIRKLLSDVSVVALPSHREGLPTSLTEAAASGLPIVATNVAGCNEVVRHEVNGLLIPREDFRALASAIERLFYEPSLCERFGLESRKLSFKYDSYFVNKRVLSIYQ